MGNMSLVNTFHCICSGCRLNTCWLHLRKANLIACIPSQQSPHYLEPSCFFFSVVRSLREPSFPPSLFSPAIEKLPLG